MDLDVSSMQSQSWFARDATEVDDQTLNDPQRRTKGIVQMAQINFPFTIHDETRVAIEPPKPSKRPIPCFTP